MWKRSSMRVSRFLAVILIFFTPLLFVTNTNEAFEFPKMYFVYLIGGTLLGVEILRNLVEDKLPKIPNNYILAFVASQVIATIFSTHIHTSLWGYYSRFNGGLISLLVFLGIYIVSISYQNKKFRNTLVDVALLGAVPTSFFAIFQHFTLNPGERVYSTLGQPNWLGAYLVMLFPLIIEKYMQVGSVVGTSRHNDSKFIKENKKLYVFWGSLLTAVYAGIWYTYSLSSLLGLLAALGSYFVLERRNVLSRWKSLGVVFILMLAVSVLSPGVYGHRISDILVDFSKFGNSSDTKQISNGSNLKEIANSQPGDDTVIEKAIDTANYKANAEKSETKLETELGNQRENQISDPGYIRIYLWKGSLRLATSSIKNMIVGTGLQTFPYEFQQFRPPELNYSSEWNFILNKPHNYYLELLTETGMLGLGTYVGLLYWVLKNVEKDKRAGIIGLMVTNIFGWPTVTTTLLFWFYLGYTNTSADANQNT